MKIKLLILVFTFFIAHGAAFAKGYNMSFPLPGDSIANDSLQFKVLKDIYPLMTEKNSFCFDHKVSNTQILHYPYDVVKKDNKYIKGYWKELWTIDSCGEKTQIPVTFYIHKKNTSYIIEKGLIAR